MPIFKADDAVSVELVKNILNDKLKINLTKTTDKFDLFDLIDNDNKYVVEVKKRSNEYNKYPTTMIGYNKYLKSLEYVKKNFNVLFVFIFNDGIYYYKIQDEKFEPKKGGRFDRGFDEIKNYIYINIEKLMKLE